MHSILNITAILVALLAALSIIWNGLRIQIGTTKDDPSKASFSFEIYPLSRFFKKNTE